MDTRDVGASTVVEVRALSKRYGAEGRKHDGSVTQALDRVSFACLLYTSPSPRDTR